VHFFGLSISDDVSNVFVDSRDVVDGVCESFLEKSNWILEDSSPGLDSLDIWLSSLAVLEVSVNAGDDLTNFGDPLDYVGDILLFEISNGNSKFSFDALGISKAWLDLVEIVVLDESIKKTSDKLDNLVSTQLSNCSDSKGFGD
jgi:hypothetical protein